MLEETSLETTETEKMATRPKLLTAGTVWVVCLILGLVIIIRLVSFLQISLDWLNYPYWRPGSEGLILDETLRIRHGLPIYDPITQTAFISGPYPPVFYYLNAWLMNFGGEGIQTGRWLAFGSALVCAGLVGWLVWQGSRSLWAACLFGPLLLLTSPFLIWASRNRGDVLMVAFNLAGLVCLSYLNLEQITMPARSSQAKRFFTKNLLLALVSIVFFGLAFYTKQTGVAAPLAVCVWLMSQNWRFGLKYGAGLVAGVALPFVILEFVTRHEFYRHIVSYHALPWTWANFSHWTGVFVADNPVVVISSVGLMVVLMGSWFQSRRIKRRIEPLPPSTIVIEAHHARHVSLVAWFGLLALMGLVTTGVEGADHNHLLLPVAAVVTGAGVAFGWCLRGPKMAWRWVGLAVALALAVQLWFGWDSLLQNYSFDLTSKFSSAEQTQMGKIIAYIKTVNGPILSEEVALPALAGKEAQVEYNDVYTLGLLAEAGKWNSDGLAEQVRQKHFALILVPFDLDSQRAINHKVWPPAVLQAIKDNYQVKFRDLWFMYVPKA